jgi:hypothetical protein
MKFFSNSFQELMELGGKAAYHAKVVLVRDKENNRTQNASPSANLPSEREMCPWAISKVFGD